MANKQYISIIRLFRHSDIDTGDAFNLSRAKKQLQAEFSIAQNGFIEIDGHTYTKQDVFEELDRPGFPERLIFHQQIWENETLLGLLETNSVYLPDLGAAMQPFAGNEKFDAFFSPYFAGPFIYLSRTLLSEGKLEQMGTLLAFEQFLLPEEREEAFRPLRLFLDENVRLFRNISADNYAMMRPKILHWIETDWHLFFNNLPHEFYEIKNDLTASLINIGVAVQKTHKKDCVKISEQLISLQDTPESLRSIIVSNHAIYKGSSSKSSSWGNYFWIGWVIFIIIRLVASDGCGDSKPKYNFDEFIRQQNIQRNNTYSDSAIQKLLNKELDYKPDSFFQKLADSSKKIRLRYQ